MVRVYGIIPPEQVPLPAHAAALCPIPPGSPGHLSQRRQVLCQQTPSSPAALRVPLVCRRLTSGSPPFLLERETLLCLGSMLGVFLFAVLWFLILGFFTR